MVAADMLALLDQSQGFAPDRRSPAGQSSDSTELLSAGRGLLPKVFARAVLDGEQSPIVVRRHRPASFLTASC